MRFIPLEVSGPAYKIGIDDLDFIDYNPVSCNFNILGARLLNLTYPSYLRYLVSLGAQLRGRAGYCYAIFKDKSTCQNVCNKLNAEWKKIEPPLKGETNGK